MTARAAVVVLFAILGIGALSIGCGAAEKSAAKDPMKCERDPACSRARGSYIDCTRQCADDQECIKLCEQMQTDRMGH
jgi:hypothetical protein